MFLTRSSSPPSSWESACPLHRVDSKRSWMYESGSFLIMLSSWRTIFFSSSVSFSLIIGLATMSPTRSFATSAVSLMVMP